VYLLVTNVPGCVSRNANTLGLQHLKFVNTGVGSRPPDRACVVHHGTDELLVEQHTISDGQTTPRVEEGVRQTQSLSRLRPYLVDMSRPGKPCVKGYIKVSCCFSPLYWFSEKLGWPGSLDASRGLDKEHCVALRDVDSHPPIP
jgi:hypothetical protein